jgi:hypothetical protein
MNEGSTNKPFCEDWEILTENLFDNKGSLKFRPDL